MFKTRLIALAGIAMLVILAPLAFAQEATPTALFDETGVPIQFENVLADLSTRLGTTVTRQNISGFTWAEEVFSDASLGCPQEGQSYAQAVTPGYRFNVDFEGITYDYRVSQNDNTVVFCSEAASSGETAETPEVESSLVVCDSTLMLLTFVAQRDYGFVPLTSDLTGFEFGQFRSDFANLMAGSPEDAAATEEAPSTTEEADAGTTADEALSDVTLQPGILANEDPACTALRAEVEAFLIEAIRGEAMESGS
jgi:hypothetical protein